MHEDRLVNIPPIAPLRAQRLKVAYINQIMLVTLLNVSTHNATWPDFAEMLCKRFGYDKINAMVTGGEGADAACKIARKWGTQVKGIPSEKVMVLGVSDNYHGLSSGVWPLMNPDQSRVGRCMLEI